MRHVFTWLAERIVQHRRGVAGLVLVSALVATYFASRVRFDFTPQTLFAGHGSLIREQQAFREKFGYDDAVILVALEATGDSSKEHDALSPAALNWQNAITRRLERIPHVTSVESLTRLQVLGVDFSSEAGVKPIPLMQSFPITADEAEAARERIERLPALRGSLLNRDSRVAAIPVFLDPRQQDVDTVRAIVREVRQALDEEPVPTGYRVHVGGLPVIRADTISDLLKDQSGLLPLGGVVYLLALTLMFRRVSGSLLPLIAVGIGLVWTIGLVVALGQSLNVVSNVLPMLLLIIGISTSVQIVSAYSEESHRHPDDRLRATRLTLAHAAQASGMATLTTLIGFASLMTARSVVLKQFGGQAMLGVSLLWVALMLVLGCGFPWFSAPPHVSRAGPVIRFAAVIAGRIGHVVSHHPVRGLLVCAMLTVASLGLGSRVTVNSSTVETYGPENAVVKTLRFFEDELSGVMPIEVVLTSDKDDTFLDPVVFRKVEALDESLEHVEGVRLVRSYVDLHRPALDKFAEAAGENGLATLKRRLARNDRLFRQFPEVTHYRQFLTLDGREARLMLRTRDLGTRRLLQVIRSVEKELATTFPPGSGLRFHLSGDGYVNAIAMDGLIRDLYSSLLTASCVIFGMIAIQFRSLRAGIIAALPNLTPLAFTLGYVGLRGYDMNVGNAIVFTTSLGFADDTTIHFLFRFRDELHKTGDVLEAIDRTFAGTGRAILQTSLLIIAGLAVLLFSEFLPTRRFGELTLITLMGNLLGVLFILPACLALFWPAPGKTPPAAT